MKKKLPLNIIKGFQPKENENIYLVKPESGTGFIMNFLDKDPESDFYFRIEKFEPKNNQFLVDFKPSTANTISNSRTWHTIDGVNKKFKDWTNLINEYNSTETIFDDPIILGFAEDYLNEIKIIEPDAEYKPFNPRQLLLLDEHLEKIESGISKYKTDSNAIIIDEIISETRELRDNLTKKPKNQILRKMTLIWAKISKQGLPLIKEFISEGVKEAIKIGIKALIET